MTLLLRKDRPWIVAFAVCGVVALAPATIDGGFVRTFVVTPRSRDGLFAAAWITGLVLGLFAACFDEALGTRELLAQRPLSPRAVLRARLSGCAAVLATWFVMAPVGAYLLCAFADRGFEPGHWRQLPAILATMVPAISACAIGLLAGSLPFVWWGRLWCLALLLLVPFSAIHWLADGSVGTGSSLPWFVGGHFVLAIAAVAVTLATAATHRDPDRPLPAFTRLRVVAPLLAVCAVLAAAMCGELGGELVRRLHAAYPEAGTEKGRIMLSVRDERCRHVVDEHHVATGEQLPLASRWFVENEVAASPSEFFRIEGPRWSGAESSRFAASGRLYVEPDGRVLWVPGFDRSPQAVVKPDGAPFAAGTRLCGRTDRSTDLALAEPGGGEVWWFEPDRVTVRPVPLPDGDRVDGTARLHRSDDLLAVPEGLAFGSPETLVQGERGAYALRDGDLVAAGVLATRDSRPHRKWRGRIDDPDLLTWTLAFDGRDGVPPFAHTFTPRTLVERFLAGLALTTSLLRPPLLQAGGALLPAEGVWREPHSPPLHRAWWLFDPLVAGGRRWWLVLASVVVAAVLAWLVRVRLLRLGADGATIHFWVGATLLLGPVGALASIACERERAYGKRLVQVPAPPPRIVTAALVPENVA